MMNNHVDRGNLLDACGDSAIIAASSPIKTKNIPPAAAAASSSSSSAVESSFHPLQNEWTLWFYKNDKDKPWEENQMALLTFESVEEFWTIYNTIELASNLPSGCDYSLFKAGIKPMWEDDANVEGGRWLIQMQRVAGKNDNNNDDSSENPVDNYWLEVLLCLVGESFGSEEGKLINGAVVSIRNRGNKIGVWLKDKDDAIAVASIGLKLKERLGLHKLNVQIYFHSHEDTKSRSGSTPKSLYKL